MPKYLLVALFLGVSASAQARIEGCFEDALEARRFVRITTLSQNTAYLYVQTRDPKKPTQPTYFFEKDLCLQNERRYQEPGVGDVCQSDFAVLSYDAEDRIRFGKWGRVELYFRADAYKCGF
jgi:hypothetical protein